MAADKTRVFSFLEIRSSGEPDQVVIWDTVDITAGRHPEQDIVLAQSEVSRAHSEFKREGTTYFIEDCHTSNGTYLNGTQVRREQLNPNDVILIGETEITFRQSTENPLGQGNAKYASQLKGFDLPGGEDDGEGGRTVLGLGGADDGIEGIDDSSAALRPPGEQEYQLGDDVAEDLSAAPQPRDLDLELDDFDLPDEAPLVDPEPVRPLPTARPAPAAKAPVAPAPAVEPPSPPAAPPVAAPPAAPIELDEVDPLGIETTVTAAPPPPPPPSSGTTATRAAAPPPPPPPAADLVPPPAPVEPEPVRPLPEARPTPASAPPPAAPVTKVQAPAPTPVAAPPAAAPVAKPSAPPAPAPLPEPELDLDLESDLDLEISLNTEDDTRESAALETSASAPLAVVLEITGATPELEALLQGLMGKELKLPNLSVKLRPKD